MIHSRLDVMATLALLFCLPLSASPAFAQDPPKPVDDRTELKNSMKARYPLLERLRDAGKVGETPNGEVKLVKSTPAGDAADPKDPSKGTLGEVVAAENKDRQALYVLLAKELKLTAAEVGQQNGLRNLDKASPDHWIEVKGKWVQRKSIKSVGPAVK